MSDNPRCVFVSGPRRGNAPTVNVAVDRLSHPRHFLSQRLIAITAIGIKLYSDPIGIEVIQKDLNFKSVMLGLRHQSLPRQSEGSTIFLPEYDANRPTGFQRRLCSPPVPYRSPHLADNTVPCIGESRGWRKSAESGAPCSHACARPMQWECHLRSACRTRGLPAVRAGRKASWLRWHPRLDRRHVPDRHPKPSLPRACKPPPTSRPIQIS